ncbi:MAG: DUF6383 domain-containing protein [Tannerella sp.]|nr:DUF6383 domain-containing protein [Tannerella sp.]
MNKKIFTLLAGAFLMLAAVFSVKAQGQHGLWDKSRLSLGDSVRTLKEGMNPGYYHLRVDSVVDYNGTTTTYIKYADQDSAHILYMGKNGGDSIMLFVDSINNARTSFGNYFTQGATSPKAEESAAGLWCVNVEKFAQGKNILFDFTNKLHGEMLEVDTYGYENEPKNLLGFTEDRASHTFVNRMPGGVSGWEFSGTYATILESRPLISYITPDTVAVLCMKPSSGMVGTGDSVFVRIADATDVQDGLVDGVIYFRLMHAAPFIVDKNDYNTYFGIQPASRAGRLKFVEDVTSGYDNPFTMGDLTADYLNLADSGTRVLVSGSWHPWIGTLNIPDLLTPNADNYDTVRYSGALLDSLGYMKFTSGSKRLQVLRKYFEGNIGGNQFLQIGLGDDIGSTDSIYYGQYAFRMVYYPSGDSIYINPYQATYLPLPGSDAQIKYNANNFTDSVTLSVFTYYADTAALQNPNGVFWGSPSTLDSLNLVTARLKYGDRTDHFYGPYTPHQRLYVSLQDLTSARRLTLNSTATKTNNTINTHINFGIYNQCAGGTDKVTVAPDVYLIRNTAGQYLTVPLYSATDSAKWEYLDENVDPRYVPAFHWVVEQRYTNSQISPVKITNREFGWLEFDNVQLYNDVRPLRLRSGHFTWNDDNFKVKAAATDWENKDGSGDGYAFIKVGKEFKNNPLLGYTWIDPDTSVVNQYAFQYRSGVADMFLGWDGDYRNYPNTDTLVYVNYQDRYQKLYFSLDTISDEYGQLDEYGFKVTSTTQIADLVTLKRQPYRLTYKDPFKYTCINEFCMSPDENKFYSITKKGHYKNFLGKPVFYLRDVYKVDGQAPYFAMVQRIDTLTNSTTYFSDSIALAGYLNDEYGVQLTRTVMGQVGINGSERFNPGLFVAKFEPGTSKLKMTLRADVNNVVSTFSMEKDNDPIYRRFNTVLEGETNDNPDYVHFHSQAHPTQLLFENTGYIQPQYWADHGKKNFLGIVNKNEYPNLESHSSTTIYVDTAYVNRGTGYIKPQYMLAVRPQPVEAAMGCDQYGEPTIPLKGYVEAHYLINAYDSAYTKGGTNYDYIWKQTGWVRLVFTRAIHAEDYLYILGDADLTKADVYGQLKNGNKMFDLDKLKAYALNADNGMHAIYLGNNLHKDCVFSFRLAERNANDFYIESETTARDTATGPMIAPCEGGWLKEDNGPMTVTPSDEVFGMEQALLMNVRKAGADEKPTGIDDVETSNVTVVGGAGAVTVLNAAGKTVVINNILGQTIAQTVLTSDNETITVSKGVVIVSIDGEDTVKTLVK